MGREGFSAEDYNVMENSCNTFTEELARRLDVLGRYPAAIHNQTRLGEILCPVVRALDFIPESRSPSPRPPSTAPSQTAAATLERASTARRRLSIASIASVASVGTECQNVPTANGLGGS